MLFDLCMQPIRGRLGKEGLAALPAWTQGWWLLLLWTLARC